MGDRKGDESKKTPDCAAPGMCVNLVETSSPTDFDGETYDCPICGEHFRIYYEDMA